MAASPPPRSGRGEPATPARAAIALGGNIGDSLAILEEALGALELIRGVSVLARSRWHRSAAVGPSQRDFVNGCAVLETTLSARVLLRRLLATELAFGRVRQERWGPRTLDLDLILYGSLRLESEKLWVPHPRFRERAFVLIPLAELIPAWIDPVTGRTVAELANGFEDQDAVWPLEARRHGSPSLSSGATLAQTTGKDASFLQR